ncbi:MAG TPA: sulfatase-like hydrolase/transferase [Kofleriaceae bacterium]|jgi:arylsulfatase A-like enzyme
MPRTAWVFAALAITACSSKKSDPAPAPTHAAIAPEARLPPAANRTPRGAEHTVYSFVDNRLAAHVGRGGGLLVPAGSAGFAKYTRFANVMKGGKRSWELRQSIGDVKVAKLSGKTATVFVPLTAAEAGRGSVRIRVNAPSDTKITIKVNDNKDLNAKVTSGWSTAEFTVPPGQLKDGENTLELFMKNSGTAVAWIQVGGATPVPDDGQVQFYDPAKKALVLPKDGSLVYYVAIPAHARLAGDVPDPACAVAVTATADDGSTASGTFTGAGGAIDLAALAGKAARIELTGASCPMSALANAALVASGPSATLPKGAPPKYVLFVVMDSLRADRVRPWNAKARPETPNFDKLAETSAVFLSDYVQGNESQVSHASIWSSNYLAKHKAIDMPDHLADKWVTIDEVAKKAGKYTVGVSGNGYIRPSRGFGSGWDHFSNHLEKSLGLRGKDIVDAGIAAITPKHDAPWFLYLGLIDTHVTWRAKSPWIEKYDSAGYKGRFEREYGDDGPSGAPKDLTDREKDRVRALYDSNVSYQDDLVGKIVAQLQTWGIYDQTMIIITADHGDEQWEDGRVGHGGSERETLLHVPLIIHYPPLFPASRITEGTESIDIVPTLADALGVAPDPEWQGASLVPLANGGGGYPLLSFSSQYENGHGGRIGHWKLKLSGTGSPKLYDLAKDPLEKSDLWGKNEIGARTLLDPMWLLRQWNVEWKKSQWGNAADVSSRFAADLGE